MCSAFVFHTDKGKKMDQFDIFQFCINIGSAFVGKAVLYVKAGELRFWYLLLIADMFRTSRDCECNESISFLGVLFVGLGDLVNLTARAGPKDFTKKTVVCYLKRPFSLLPPDNNLFTINSSFFPDSVCC